MARLQHAEIVSVFNVRFPSLAIAHMWDLGLEPKTWGLRSQGGRQHG